MNSEANYGSSEYSAQAEELFAQYLMMVESGTAPEFEDFCAGHEDSSEELYGLHADWDNVRGLISHLDGKRGEAQGSTEGKHPAPAAPPDGVPERIPGPTSGTSWKVATSLGLLATLALGTWAYLLRESSQVLANQNENLLHEGQQTREELEVAQGNEAQLALEQRVLQQELESTQAAKDELQGRSAALALDLESEREASSELEQHRAKLSGELQQERELKRVAEAEAELLTCLVEANELIRREGRLWPATATNLSHMEAWLEEAEALAHRTAELTAELAASAESTPTPLGPPGAEDQLSARIARTRERLDGLEPWRRHVEGDLAGLWSAARTAIADRDEFPAYDGLQLEPQFPLVPLGLDPATRLWMFADLRTGTLPRPNPESGLALDDSSALVFFLVPGIEVEGAALEPFFVAQEELSPLHCQRALGDLARSSRPDSDLQAKLYYELDLTRLGYRLLSMARADLARQSGIDVTRWKRLPTRPVHTSE